ncbi:NINE protein [Trichocoleus sp. FACHB-591]|uniref:NINE protein n=1 Tax=Trichocoleus sp. FACHB-591 TaxID=2692872 RepID=UPI0016826D34|nr:NINE protein [Trichocoleus sp. FACHB-591]MBD2095518.1 NINE protein [Trichocoleus sp. FACHB-591]
MNKVGTSYLLWLGCLFGISGLHRLYNGKIATGLFWMMTWGLFGVGQFIDLFLVPDMVEEHNLKYRARLGMSPTGVPLSQPAVAATVLKPSREQLMIRLLEAAAARGGKLSVTQGVMATGLGFAEVETVLQEMVRTGYVGIDNDPVTGVITYDFKEL